MNKILGLLIVASLLTIPIQGSDYLLLSETGTSAKSIAIGNVLGFDESANAIFENPATLDRLKSTNVAFFSTSIINELNIACFSVGMKSSSGTFGLGYLQGSVNNIYQTGNNDNVFYTDGSFNYLDQTLKAAYAFSWQPGLSVGAVLSSYQKSIGSTSAKGIGTEIGAYTKLGAMDVSLVVRNPIGGKINYTNDQSETLPLQLIGSGKFSLNEGEVYGQYKYQVGKKGMMSFGYSTEIPGVSCLRGSVGYKEYAVLDAVSAGMVMGMTLEFEGLQLNYAFESGNYVENGAKHYISFSTDLNFGKWSRLEILSLK